MTDSREISIVLPYMHSPQRYVLLQECLRRLEETVEDAQICLHEIGTEQHLTDDGRCRYLFTPYQGVMHRAWALNRGVKMLATGSKLVLMDADLVINKQWFEEVKRCEVPSVAWGKIYYLDQPSTTAYFAGKKEWTCWRIVIPKIDGCAGGISCMDRQLFFDVGGVPEDFEGTWGGEDNTLFAKILSRGHAFAHFSSQILHLFHEPSTPRIEHKRQRARQMLRWSKARWDRHIAKRGEQWGR